MGEPTNRSNQPTAAQTAIESFVSTYRRGGVPQPRMAGQPPQTLDNAWQNAVRAVTEEIKAEQGETKPSARGEGIRRF